MMRGYTLLPRAKADLKEVWRYTLSRWGMRQAEIYTQQITAAIETVVLEPSLARSCDDIRIGYWRYPSGSHFIFFRLGIGGVEVVRILHNRMDHKRHV